MDLREARAIQNFLDALDSKEGMEKVSSRIAGYIKKKVREDGFGRRIIPPETVTPAECQVATDHDGLVKIVRLEPDVAAMVLTWRGEPKPMYLEAERVALGFHNISSEETTKTEQELLAYGSGIESLIEQFSIKAIHKQEDVIFCKGAGASLLAQTVPAIIGAKTSEFSQDDITALARMLSAKQLPLTTLLMSHETFAAVNSWDANALGMNVKSEVVVNGFKYPTLHGYKLVLTIKNDLIPKYWIFGFTDPEYLGEFDVLNDIRFYVKKERNLITWSAAEDVGMILANINSVALVVANGQDIDDVRSWYASLQAA